MSDNAKTKPPEPDYDPLGGVLLESDTTFGLRAATLAGTAPGLTGAGEWPELPFSWSCSSFFVSPPDPDRAMIVSI